MDGAEFARQTDALRALARGLLEDPHDAEDVVQEAWAASLEARPRDLFSWLRGATRRLAARTIRSRARRRRREQAAARPETIPADAAAEADVLRALAAELARLEEPYRTVLVLRYYRDLKPPGIAASLSVPVATVKTRLRRGLAILRARLSREHRSWALVLAPLAARPARVALVLVAVAAIGAVGFLSLAPQPRAEDARSTVPATSADEPAETGGGSGAVETAPRLRASVFVEGPEGPAAGADVRISPFDAWNDVSVARTGADGTASFEVPAEGDYEVKVETEGRIRGGVFARFPGTARIRLRTGCRLKLRLSPWPDPTWERFHWSAQGEIHTERKLAFDSGEIDTGTWPPGAVSIYYAPVSGGVLRSVRIALPEGGDVVHDLAPPAVDTTAIEVVDGETGAAIHEWTALLAAWGLGPRELTREPGESFGAYRVPAKGCTVSIDATGYARAFAGLPWDGDAPAHVGLQRGVTLRLSFRAGARPTEARVYYNSPADPTYAVATWAYSLGPIPVGEINLTEGSWDAGRLVRTVTEAEAWTADDVPPRARLDVVGIDEAGLFTSRQVVTGPPGSETAVELSWPQTVRHRFLVRDAEGRPISAAEVRILDTGRRDMPLGGVRTDAAGRASVRGLRPERSYALLLIHRGGTERQDLRLSGPDGETVLTAVEQERHARRVLVLDEAGLPVARARVQFVVRDGPGAFALTGDDGIAVGWLQPGCALQLIAVAREPGGAAEYDTLDKPPAEDPIVYRGGLGTVRVRLDIQGEGLVHAKLKGGRQDQEMKVHVHGRGLASFGGRVEPGEYRVEASLDGRAVEHALVVRWGEPAVVPLRFDR